MSYWVKKIHWRRDRLPILVSTGFPCGSAGKESAYNVGDLGSIPGLGRSPGEGKGYPLKYSGLENSMGCIVQGVAKSLTWLRNFHFHLEECCLLFKYLGGFSGYLLFLTFNLIPLCSENILYDFNLLHFIETYDSVYGLFW